MVGGTCDCFGMHSVPDKDDLASGADAVTSAHPNFSGGRRLPPSHEALVLEAPRLQAFNSGREMRTRRQRIDQAIHAGELTDGKAHGSARRS